MDKSLKDVSEHMRGLGLAALAHANWHANYISYENPWWSELSVVQAAHAAEILIKARIAEEHPLLIFEHLPKSTMSTAGSLTVSGLYEGGRTYQFRDLPDRLWATTGIRLSNIELFHKFGALRNSIQHFAVPSEEDAAQRTVDFIYEVIDPFINDCWGLYAVDFNEDHEPHIYLVEGLVRSGVLFRVSNAAAMSVRDTQLEWPAEKGAYREEMLRRLSAARAEPEQ